MLAVLIVSGLGVGGFLAVRAASSGAASVRPPATASEPLPPRPPVRVVENLPALKAVMASPANARFMGAVLVARGDTILYRQAYGPADVAAGRPLTVETPFRLASISKQFTAAAILKLQDEGKLSVEDPVCRWIQPCPAAWAPIRIRHLLSHTSGIPDLMARPGWGQRRVMPATLEQLTEDSKAFALQFPPGSKVAYDNAGFNLAAMIVQQASGMAFDDYVRTRLFVPLGLTETGIGDTPALAMGYANYPSGLAAQTQPNVSIVRGAGAVYSTLDDMLAWERALHHGRVVSAAAYQQMLADHSPPDTKPERGRPHRAWGFGLFSNRLGEQLDRVFEDRQIYHTGSWSGFRNLITYQPDADVTVIVLSNNYHQRDQVFLIAQQAMAEALGRPFPTKAVRGSPARPAAGSPDRQD
ncbi:hypothetical protein BH10PSE2_BH10PSE2_09010 [soil metagenome]